MKDDGRAGPWIFLYTSFLDAYHSVHQQTLLFFLLNKYHFVLNLDDKKIWRHLEIRVRDSARCSGASREHWHLVQDPGHAGPASGH
jgi:hypothetical protein